MKSKIIKGTPRIGMRIIKTAIAVFIVLLIHVILLLIDQKYSFDRSDWKAPSNMYTPFFAGIAAVYALHKNTKASLNQARIRSLGSVIGGYFGMILILISEYVLINKLNMKETNFPLFELITFAWVSLGIIPLILITVKVRQKDAVFISCLTYLSVTISIRNGGMPVFQFATNRVLSTIIGVGVSLLINNMSLLMHKNKNILFVTSLNNNFIKDVEHIPDFMKYKLNDLYFKDMPLCFVTTRSTGYLEKVFKDVEVEFPMVVMNGSAVYDFKNKKYDVVKNINSNIRIKIDEVLSRQNMNAFVSTINDNILHCYHNKLTNQGEIDFFEKNKHEEGYNFVRGTLPSDLEASFYLIIDEKEKIEALMNSLKEEVNELVDMFDYPHTTRGFYCLKLNSTEATKEDAIMYLKKKYNYDKVIISISGRTDLPLTELSDFSVCLSAAPKYVRDSVDLVVESNDPSSILKLFDKIYHKKNYNKIINKLKGNKK